MLDKHGTWNALAVKPYNDLGEGGHIGSSWRREENSRIDKSCDRETFSGKYRKTSSEMDIGLGLVDPNPCSQVVCSPIRCVRQIDT